MKNLILSCALCAALLAAPSVGLSFYRCEVDGVTTFSSSPACGANGQRVTVEEQRGASGLRPGEIRMLNRIRQEELDADNRRTLSRERDARRHVGYADRLRIRELEMEKRRLQGSLDDGASVGKSWSVKTQIEGIDREIRAIRSGR